MAFPVDNVPTLFGPLPTFNALTTIVKTPFGVSLSGIVDELEPLPELTTPPNPTLNDFPDSTEGCIHAGSLAHVLKALAKGFHHPLHNDHAPISCGLWLLMVANLLNHIKQSIAVTSCATKKPSAVFNDLDTEESVLLAAVAAHSKALDSYFTSCEDDPEGWDQCMSYLDQFHVSLTEMDWKAIVGDALDHIQAAHML